MFLLGTIHEEAIKGLVKEHSAEDGVKEPSMEEVAIELADQAQLVEVQLYMLHTELCI
jgi:hypothetical protein